MTHQVSLLDYGIGNLRSVHAALAHVGAGVEIVRQEAEIARAERLVVPGVGAFGDCVDTLETLGLFGALERFLMTDRPFLGICVGMQMMVDYSEEFGRHKGLGAIRGVVRRIPDAPVGGPAYKVPHVGWTPLRRPEGADWRGTILHDCSEDESVYFVHSYAVVPERAASSLAEADYHSNRIAAVIHDRNHYGCQFHPEKSGSSGLSILSRFVSL